METSSISLDLTKRSFTISGSEEFVSARLAQMLELVSTATSPSIPSSEPKTIMPDSFDRDDASLKDQCETAGIFYLDQETGLPVLQERVPGENKREKCATLPCCFFTEPKSPLKPPTLRNNVADNRALIPGISRKRMRWINGISSKRARLDRGTGRSNSRYRESRQQKALFRQF